MDLHYDAEDRYKSDYGLLLYNLQDVHKFQDMDPGIYSWDMLELKDILHWRHILVDTKAAILSWYFDMNIQHVLQLPDRRCLDHTEKDCMDL